MTGAGLCELPFCDIPARAAGLCKSHYERQRRGVPIDTPVNQRKQLDEKYEVRESGCWIWTSTRNELGYGLIGRDGRTVRAHRYLYELHVGQIPAGLVLDHLCRNPSCVNPGHLEPVTQAENVRRGLSPGAVSVRTGQCFRGHEWTLENTYRRTDGSRVCRACVALLKHERRHAEVSRDASL